MNEAGTAFNATGTDRVEAKALINRANAYMPSGKKNHGLTKMPSKINANNPTTKHAGSACTIFKEPG